MKKKIIKIEDFLKLLKEQNLDLDPYENYAVFTKDLKSCLSFSYSNANKIFTLLSINKKSINRMFKIDNQNELKRLQHMAIVYFGKDIF